MNNFRYIFRFTTTHQDDLESFRVLVFSARTTRESNIFSMSDLLSSIRRACDRWAKTKEGRAAYENSSGDFNFGDLASYLGDFSLYHELTKEGIELTLEEDLDINNHVDYDTVLMSDPDESNAPPIVTYNE